MTTSRVVETSVTVNNRTKLTRAIVGHQFMKTQNERKRLRAHQEPCAHLTQVQAEKNMWDFNVIYVAAIHLRRANTALQCWNNVGTIQNNVAPMLQRCVPLKIVVVNRLV